MSQIAQETRGCSHLVDISSSQAQSATGCFHRVRRHASTTTATNLMDPNSNATTRTVSKGRNDSWLPAVMAVPLVLAGCGGGSGAAPATIGGNVAGLRTGNSVVLQDDGGDATSVSVNGSFAFP